MRILVLTLMMSVLSQGAFGSETVKRLWTMLCNADLSGFSYLGDLDDDSLLGRADKAECKQASILEVVESEECKKTLFKNIPEDLKREKIVGLLSLEDLKYFSEASTSSRDLAREVILQKGFTLNMKYIKKKDIVSLTILLSETRDVTKLKIKNLRWEILKAVLESNLELKFDNLEKLDISNNLIYNEIIEDSPFGHVLIMYFFECYLGYVPYDQNDFCDINNFLLSRMSSLTNLDLENNLIRDAGAIANIESLTLTSLNLGRNQIGPAGAIAIYSMDSLTSLNLGWNQIGDEGATAIAGMAKLISLSLGENQIGPAGATAIARMASLTNLDLEDNQIEDAGATAIANSPQMARLTSLNLMGNHIGVAGARAIANSPQMASLTSLNLSYNQLGDEGAQAIANSQYMARLTILVLSLNRIGLAGATAIAESEHMARLTSLNLYNNQIRDDVKVVIINRFRQRHPKCVVVL
jgi:Leucine-rich repeat (LRR) protein